MFSEQLLSQYLRIFMAINDASGLCCVGSGGEGRICLCLSSQEQAQWTGGGHQDGEMGSFWYSPVVWYELLVINEYVPLIYTINWWNRWLKEMCKHDKN